MDSERARRQRQRRRSIASVSGQNRPRSAGSQRSMLTFTEKKRPKTALPSVYEDSELEGKRLDMNAASDEQNMRVFVRCRPLCEQERSTGNKEIVTAYAEDSVVTIAKPAKNGGVLKSERGALHEYQFDSVFGPLSSTLDVYNAAAKHLVKATLNGINSTVFAYGATGAGKTFTMMGCPAEPGIISRALEDIFKGVEEAKGKIDLPFPSEEYVGEEVVKCTWTVKISFLEVYNETIFDLLTDNQKPLIPCEDPTDFTVKVLGLTKVKAECVEHVITLLEEGNARRKMEPTAANQVSSRSHAVLQVVIEKESVLSKPGRVPKYRSSLRNRVVKTESLLSMIDLAGSERAAATQNKGARLREGANINRSLLALANCINALSTRGGGKSRKATRVKYRDSKLTHLLKSSLEGKCMLSMIAAINPCEASYEESHNTLKYANRAKDIKVTAKVNALFTQDGNVSPEVLAALEAENQQLRRELENTTKTPGGTRRRKASKRTSAKRSESKENLDTTDTEVSTKRKKRKEVYRSKNPALDSPLPSVQKRSAISIARPLPFGDRTNEGDPIKSSPAPYKEKQEVAKLKAQLREAQKLVDEVKSNASTEKCELQARIKFLESKNEAISRMAAAESKTNELEAANRKIQKLENLVQVQQEEIEALKKQQESNEPLQHFGVPPLPKNVGDVVKLPAPTTSSLGPATIKRRNASSRRQSNIPRLYHPQSQQQEFKGLYSMAQGDVREPVCHPRRTRASTRRQSLTGPSSSTHVPHTSPMDIG